MLQIQNSRLTRQPGVSLWASKCDSNVTWSCVVFEALRTAQTRRVVPQKFWDFSSNQWLFKRFLAVCSHPQHNSHDLDQCQNRPNNDLASRANNDPPQRPRCIFWTPRASWALFLREATGQAAAIAPQFQIKQPQTTNNIKQSPQMAFGYISSIFVTAQDTVPALQPQAQPQAQGLLGAREARYLLMLFGMCFMEFFGHVFDAFWMFWLFWLFFGCLWMFCAFFQDEMIHVTGRAPSLVLDRRYGQSSSCQLEIRLLDAQSFDVECFVHGVDVSSGDYRPKTLNS